VSRRYEPARPILAFALLACACSASPPRARAPAPPPIADERLDEPYLPVRTEFTVILEQPIGTRVARQPFTFSARVRHPVRSPQNEIVIQTDARVRGRIVAIEQRPALHIKIRFDDVDTTWGREPITATIRSAEPYATSMSGTIGGMAPYDAALYMPIGDPPTPLPLYAQAAAAAPPRALGEPSILVPRGAELRIMLVKPIVAPPRVRSAR
jgi:hypothetical protein